MAPFKKPAEQHAQIENSELRLGLAGLRDMFIDAAQEQQLALQVSAEELYPRIMTSPELAALRRVSREFVTGRQEAGLSPQEQMAGGRMPTYRDVAFPNAVEVQGILNLKMIWYEAAVAELRPLLPHLERLIGLVGSEGGVPP